MSSWNSEIESTGALTRVTWPAYAGTSPGAAASAFNLHKYLLLAGLHALLGLVCKQIPQVSTAYAWGTLLLGVSWASTQKKPEKIAALAAYVMGAEVLWRMTHAAAFWEFGKYAVIAILAVACQRWRPIRSTPVATWYIALLIPSSLLPLSELDFSLARQQVSFNLSGPLALAVCAAFFSRMRLDAASLLAIARAAVLPLFSISAVVLYGIVTATKLTFGTESNRLMAGGFAANQVSAAFSVGITLTALMAVLYCTKQDRVQRAFWLTSAMLFGAQSALTFSRSGLYMSCAAVVAAVISTAKTSRLRRVYMVTGLSLYVVAMFVVYPLLNDFTTGALEARFNDTGVTGRDLLMRSDLEVWMQSPLFGVGPGMASEHRAITFYAAAAHCEITRTLAEHGCLGLAALAILCVDLWKRLRVVRDVRLRGFLIATASFGLICMASNAMRIVAPSFMIGLAFAVERMVERNPDHR